MVFTISCMEARCDIANAMGALSDTISRPARALTFGDLRVLDKRQQLVPLTLNRAQHALIRSLTGRDLVLKARQLGISTIVQAHLFLTAIQRTARIGTLAHDAATTDKLRDMAQFFYEGLPEDVQPKRSINNATKATYPATHSTVYIATAGNRTAGRGGTYSHVHGSEVAYWKDAAYLMAGLMQGVPTDGQIILESTANGQRGWFYEQCMRALDGDSAWTLHFFPWWYDDGYRVETPPLVLTSEEAHLARTHGLDDAQIAWRRAKQRELGELFAQEYPESAQGAFISSGRGYFRLAEAMFSAEPGAAPQEGHRYVAGLDFGQANDYTACAVIDATTRQQVALLRANREPWAALRARVVQLCERWRVHTLVAEANSMGGTNIEALWGELSDAGCQTELRAFQTQHANKAAVMAELRLALEEGGLRLLNDPAQRHELTVFTSEQMPTGAWQLGAPDGEHDDCVIALALAWHAVSGGMVIFGA